MNENAYRSRLAGLEQYHTQRGEGLKVRDAEKGGTDGYKEQVFLNYLRCLDDIGWGLDYPTLRWWGMEEVPHKKHLNDFFRGITGDAARRETYNEEPVTGDARLCDTTASLCGLEGSGQDTAIRKAGK